MSTTFDDEWLWEGLLVDVEPAPADAILSLYKDKVLRTMSAASESLYTVVPDIFAPSRADPQLERNLLAQFALRPDQYPGWTQAETLGRVRVVSCFNHSMALAAWAERLLAPEHPRHAILHFDAHDDLASPKVGLTESVGVFTAPVGRATLDLRDASSIEEFVRRGFIGIGSFIVPLLHAVEFVELIHVDRDAPDAVKSFGIHPESLPYPIPHGGGINRPVVRFDGDLSAPRRYTRTSEVQRALAQAANFDVILDIDLDYFCNALDDHAPSDQTPTVSAADVTRMIEELGAALLASRIVPALVTVAMSPGFFPSDYWASALTTLRGVLAKL